MHPAVKGFTLFSLLGAGVGIPVYILGDVYLNYRRVCSHTVVVEVVVSAIAAVIPVAIVSVVDIIKIVVISVVVVPVVWAPWAPPFRIISPVP
jgi:hypothetical protein